MKTAKIRLRHEPAAEAPLANARLQRKYKLVVEHEHEHAHDHRLHAARAPTLREVEFRTIAPARCTNGHQRNAQHASVKRQPFCFTACASHDAPPPRVLCVLRFGPELPPHHHVYECTPEAASEEVHVPLPTVAFTAAAAAAATTTTAAAPSPSAAAAEPPLAPLPTAPPLVSAWAGGGGPARGTPPAHTDFDAFPPLNGRRPSGFALGRTHSFSTAIQAAASSSPGPRRPRSPRRSSPSGGGGGRLRASNSSPAVSALGRTSPPRASPAPAADDDGGGAAAAAAAAPSASHAAPPPLPDPPPPLPPPPSDASSSSAPHYAALARADVSGVLDWLRSIGLGAYCEAFGQAAVDGKVLCTLSEQELETELRVASRLHRRRLALEVEHVRAAAPPAPPVPPRRQTSEPEAAFRLEEVEGALELAQVRAHVERSCGAGAAAVLRPTRVQRVVNAQLAHRLERTARALVAPHANRAVAPQGGYFHGSSVAATRGICASGFDPNRWRGGVYGRGQYLSADALKAAGYARGAQALLLCDAYLGRAWEIVRGAPPPDELAAAGGWETLSAESMIALGYDSLVVPETDEIVVYRRFQAVPRYVIHFEVAPAPQHAEGAAAAAAAASGRTSSASWDGAALHACSLATYDGNRYEQRLHPAAPWRLGDSRRRTCRAFDRRAQRDVFLKLVPDSDTARREAEALRAVGADHAAEFLGSFDLQPTADTDGGIVLVLEAATPGADACISSLCRRADPPSAAGGGGVSHGGSRSGEALLVTAFAQRVLQLVARVHEVGLVHCDLKPQHFMRFGGGGTLKLVDFGSAVRQGWTTRVAHSRRYCPPELAEVVCTSPAATTRVRAAHDVWSAGLVLYELFVGRPLFVEDVTYATIARAAVAPRLREHVAEVGEARVRLLLAMLVAAPDERPSAAELLQKSLFRHADDTVERRRVEVAAFFSNARNDLRLMREIKELTDALSKSRREVCPAARLSDVAALLHSELRPRIVSFSGHEFAGMLLFEPDEPGGGGAPRVPTADELVAVLSPEHAPELQSVVLNACKTEALGLRLRALLPHLSVIAWRTLALDAAVKAFSRGFYQSLARGNAVPFAAAFAAGRASMLAAGFCEGDPEEHRHHPAHEHLAPGWRRAHPEWRRCPGCNPPVHGEPVLLTGARTMPARGSSAELAGGDGAGEREP